jgi:hypothetical protein
MGDKPFSEIFFVIFACEIRVSRKITLLDEEVFRRLFFPRCLVSYRSGLERQRSISNRA